MRKRAEQRKIGTPVGSVNYALVAKGPVPRRRFKLGEVTLAHHVFSIIPRRGRKQRRAPVLLATGSIETSATARRPRRRDGDLERTVGLAPTDVAYGIPTQPRYRAPGE